MDSKQQIPFYAKEWREYRGLSLKDAAAQAGILVGHLSNVESRKIHFTEHDLAALANAYAIHPAMFLNLNPTDPADKNLLELALASANDENG